MADSEFPQELIERCILQVLASTDTRDMINRLLRESGHAGLVEALKSARDFVLCYRGVMDNLAELDKIADVLRKAGETG